MKKNNPSRLLYLAYPDYFDYLDHIQERGVHWLLNPLMTKYNVNRDDAIMMLAYYHVHKKSKN